jgi:hypothetical protein
MNANHITRLVGIYAFSDHSNIFVSWFIRDMYIRNIWKLRLTIMIFTMSKRTIGAVY